MNNDLYLEIQNRFNNGDKYTNKDLKKILQDIYDEHYSKAKAKASDIRYFGFDFRRIKIKVDDNWINGLHLIKL